MLQNIWWFFSSLSLDERFPSLEHEDYSSKYNYMPSECIYTTYHLTPCYRQRGNIGVGQKYGLWIVRPELILKSTSVFQVYWLWTSSLTLLGLFSLIKWRSWYHSDDSGEDELNDDGIVGIVQRSIKENQISPPCPATASHHHKLRWTCWLGKHLI